MKEQFRNTGSIMLLELDRLVRAKRTWLIVILLLIFPLIAGIWRVFQTRSSLTGFAFFSNLMASGYLMFLVPMVSIFYGTALISDEVENRTLQYLLTRPVSKQAIVIGKYGAYLATTLPLVLASVVLTFYVLLLGEPGDVLAVRFRTLLQDLWALGWGLISYGALFNLFGAAFRWPTLFGLIFAFGWEFVVSIIPGFFRKLTILFYLQALFPHASLSGGFFNLYSQRTSENPLAVLIPTTLVLLGLGLWIFRHKEYRT